MLTQEQYNNRLKRALHHAEADMLLSRTYGEMNGSFKGCSVGCDAYEILGHEKAGQLIEQDNFAFGVHKIVSDHDGTPEWLEHLRDSVFEGLPEDKLAWWHVELARSMPVGIDLEPAKHLISIFMLKMTLENKNKWKPPYKDLCVSAIEQVIDCHKNPEIADWSAAEAARATAEAAAWSAAWQKIAGAIINVLKDLQPKPNGKGVTHQNHWSDVK